MSRPLVIDVHVHICAFVAEDGQTSQRIGLAAAYWERAWRVLGGEGRAD